MLTVSRCAVSDEPKPTPEQLNFVEKRIRPVLIENCSECHGAKKQTMKLRLDSRAGMLRGGESGPAVVPHDPVNSLLIQAVRHQRGLKMPPPPHQKLATQVVADLVEWVRMGAPWPDADAGPAVTETAHWAYQPVRPPTVPPVRRVDWPRTAIDRFILARLEDKALSPSPPAGKHTLIRRATFDL